jgi:mannose-6-phosphate isomerase-like protein (cupin superfamily)
MKLNKRIISVKPGTTVIVTPGTRHRATASKRFDIFVISSPPYNPKDQFDV